MTLESGPVMTRPIFPRELVAEHFMVAPRILIRYESRGLIAPVRDESGTEGYGPEQIRRLWTILSLQRDLGVNLAGVEAVLQLRAHVDRLHECLGRLSHELLAEPEADVIDVDDLHGA